MAQNAFIVYATYRIIEGKANVYLFGKLENGQSFLAICPFRPYFMIKTADTSKTKEITNVDAEETEITNFRGEALSRITLDLPKDVKALRDILQQKEVRCYEADIPFVTRFLIDHNIRGSMTIEGESKKGNVVGVIYESPTIAPSVWVPKLSVLSYDIETTMTASHIHCISAYMEDYSHCFMVTDQKLENTTSCKDEKDMIEKFFEVIKEKDPDVITGWNITEFDFPVLRERCRVLKIPMRFGRTDWDCQFTVNKSFFVESRAEIPGRQVLDGLHLLRGSFIKLPNYKLNTAAKHFLGDEKLLTGEGRHDEIQELYKKDQQKLADYNIHDSKLAYDIIYASDLLRLTVQRTMLTGMLLDRVNGSIASLDFVYLVETKKRKLAAPSRSFSEREERIKGGFVRESKPGVYKNILVLDFKSLYPSIILTFNIDPATYVPKNLRQNTIEDDLIVAPNGAAFRHEEGILPQLIQTLWKQRDEAKKEKNKLASNAIKLLMNSFFGVLANPTCRFYSLDIANAITHFGQAILKMTAKKIEDMGYDVIYGDTDSIFVDVKAADEAEAKRIGEEIQASINSYYTKYVKSEYGRDNKLELEFEKVYVHFLMPRIRGSETGAKKRYAGIIMKDGKEEMDFVGLEFVRRDWTDLAKSFQLELLDRVFHEKDVRDYVYEFVKDLRAGKHDELLIYRKALRKSVAEYTKMTPPHVKAAKLLDRIESNIIEYVMTVDGPQPIQKMTSGYDYEHYVDKQLRPIADSILGFYDLTFDDVSAGTKQMGLGDF